MAMENLESQIGKNEELEKKEIIFMEEIVDRLVKTFVDELTDLGYTPEELAQFVVDLHTKSDKNYLSRILAVPKELRPNLFRKNKKSGTNLPIIQVLDNFYSQFVSLNEGREPKLGFHTTSEDIKPKVIQDRLNPKGKITWNIAGTEISDLAEGKRAYASDSYQSLYRERAPHWLYVVRLLDESKKYGEGETSWHHNSNFAIVDKLALEDIDKSVANRLSSQTQEGVDLAA